MPIGLFTYNDFERSVDFAGKLSYSSIVVLYVGAFFFAATSGLYVIARARGHRSWLNRRVLWLVLASLLVGAIFALLQGSYRNVEGRTDFWSFLVSSTIRHNKVFGLEAVRLHLWMDAMGISLAAFLAFVVSTVLIEERAEHSTSLVGHVRCLRIILYASSAFLVSAILRLRVILQWAVAYVQPTVLARKEALYLYQHLSDLTFVAISVLGLFYTGLLVAIYLPGVIALSNQVKVEKSALPLWGHLLRVAAILGPLLAGPVGEIVGRLE